MTENYNVGLARMLGIVSWLVNWLGLSLSIMSLWCGGLCASYVLWRACRRDWPMIVRYSVWAAPVAAVSLLMYEWHAGWLICDALTRGDAISPEQLRLFQTEMRGQLTNVAIGCLVWVVVTAFVHRRCARRSVAVSESD